MTDNLLFEEDVASLCRAYQEGKWSSQKCADVDPITFDPIPPDLQIRLRMKTPQGYILKCYDAISLKKLILVADSEAREPTLPDSRAPLTAAQIQRIKAHPAQVPATFARERLLGTQQRQAALAQQWAEAQEAEFKAADAAQRDRPDVKEPLGPGLPPRRRPRPPPSVLPQFARARPGQFERARPGTLLDVVDRLAALEQAARNEDMNIARSRRELENMLADIGRQFESIRGRATEEQREDVQDQFTRWISALSEHPRSTANVRDIFQTFVRSRRRV